MIREIRADADATYAEGIKSQAIAELARSDYVRLSQENRDRFAASGRDSIAADAAFAGYAVATDCIETERMYGRWATERLVAARAGYQQADRLLAEVRRFVRLRIKQRQLPTQRDGGDS